MVRRRKKKTKLHHQRRVAGKKKKIQPRFPDSRRKDTKRWRRDKAYPKDGRDPLTSGRGELKSRNWQWYSSCCRSWPQPSCAHAWPWAFQKRPLRRRPGSSGTWRVCHGAWACPRYSPCPRRRWPSLGCSLSRGSFLLSRVRLGRTTALLGLSLSVGSRGSIICICSGLSTGASLLGGLFSWLLSVAIFLGRLGLLCVTVFMGLFGARLLGLGLFRRTGFFLGVLILVLCL